MEDTDAGHNSIFCQQYIWTQTHT